MAEPPFVVPDALLLSVAFDDGRIAFPAAPPVLKIPGPPLAGAVLTNLPILWVRGDLLPMIVGAAPLLASRLAADGLPRLKFRWLEDLLTITTTAFDHTGVVALPGQGGI
jgi:hypothetical protein